MMKTSRGGVTISMPVRGGAVRLTWSKDAVIDYKGQSILATEECGRRFWSVLIRTGVWENDQWRLRQEFNTCEDACQYIDGELE